MSSTDRYVIANKDGKFASEFGGGKHFRFGDFRTEMTTFYHSERSRGRGQVMRARRIRNMA